MLEIVDLKKGLIDRKKQLLGSNQINMLSKAPNRKVASSISANTSQSG